MGYDPMIFPPLQEDFCPRRQMNIGSANAMLILNKAFKDVSINVIDKPEMLITSLETGLCPPRFVSSAWTETEIPILFKSISK